jgi:hypothetical protein
MKAKSIFFIVALLLLGSLVAFDLRTATHIPTGLAKAPNGPPANIANQPAPVSLPACPPPPGIQPITSFCANPPTNTGGATYNDSAANPAPPPGYSNYYVYEDSSQLPANVTCNNGVCSGPAGTQVTVIDCGVCVTSSSWQQAMAGDPSVCPNGYSPVNPLQNPVQCTNGHGVGANGAAVMPCGPGSHYDNALQNCADNVTNQIASVCPPGYPYLYAGATWTAKCYKYPQPIAYNCQAYQIPLGVCTPAVHNSRDRNPKGCVGPAIVCQ